MTGVSGAQNGHEAGTTVSGTQVPQAGPPEPQILRALEIIHDPRSKNEHRHEASQYLEQVKSQEDAPYIGYMFAADKSHPPIVRHFGLSLIEGAIRHRWADYKLEQRLAVREWVNKLAKSVEKDDPLFVRNKIAQLWVEVAKRSWALDWMNMDELLLELWPGSVAKKALVLEILETMSENSFGKEDVITALRGPDLSKALVDIFTPGEIMAEHFPKRDTTTEVRFGDEGWLWRISSLLGWCNDQGSSDEDVVFCALKSLSALKSAVPWAILIGIARTHCVQHICQSLTSDNKAIQLAAIETLYALYYRINFTAADVHDLVGPIYETETVNVLKQLYEWSIVPSDNIDDDKYLLCKKFSETMHNIGKFLRDSADALPKTADVPNFLDLLLKILQNDSLHVSIPILHLWAQLLNSESFGSSPPIMDLMGPLLETCSQRLIRYELLPEDSRYPSIVFLAEDVDTMPERHAFLGNYSRFGKDIVETIVRKRPFDALYHILVQADIVFRNPYDGQAPFSAQDYRKTSIAALKVDAQCSVIEAGLSGYVRWRSDQRKLDDSGAEEQQQSINSNFEKWGLQLLNLEFGDASIQQRILGLAVEFAIGPLKRNQAFVVQVFQFVISTKVRFLNETGVQNAALYIESVKDLQRFCSHQLQRIALRSYDFLMPNYDWVAAAIGGCFPQHNTDVEDKDRCLSVLFVIIQRATTMDGSERARRLEVFVEPFINKWQSPALAESLRSFSGFCDLLGLTGFQEYFYNNKAYQIQDWSDVPLDAEGQALKARVEAARLDLPLRATKVYFGISLDRSEPGTIHYEAACQLWSKYMTTILPSLLDMIGLAHVFSEPSSWTHLPVESQSIPSRILKDRFWQVGISSGSRDDFYSKVESTKSTLEGLASAIRGCLRFARETSYRLICTMSLLGDTLYRFEELPVPLSRAMFENSGNLSAHQTGTIIEMIRPIIEHCPADARDHFLTPIITEMFNALDRKVRKDWNRIDERNRAASADDDLVEEMKDESILRQLTFNCVSVVARLFDPNETEVSLPGQADATSVSLRRFVLGNPEVFKSVILFCTHALQMHDSRACGLITRVLRSIVPEFIGDDPIAVEIREFISTDVFRACITSLHDPYFVDIQSELANLIASILQKYSRLTETPAELLASLPGMTEDTVDRAKYKIFKAPNNTRQQRAVILKLLEGLRGISISEQGRFPRPEPKKARSAMEERYLTILTEVKAGRSPRESTPDLGGVADMFA